MDPASLERKVRNMTLPDLRTELRNMGLSPAGGLDTLRERLLEGLRNPALQAQAAQQAQAKGETAVTAIGQTTTDNNYVRPSGSQNVGNFITDRPTSRVLKAPGGGSSISFA